jgi:hypothetical protein
VVVFEAQILRIRARRIELIPNTPGSWAKVLTSRLAVGGYAAEDSDGSACKSATNISPFERGESTRLRQACSDVDIDFEAGGAFAERPPAGWWAAEATASTGGAIGSGRSCQ